MSMDMAIGIMQMDAIVRAAAKVGGAKAGMRLQRDAIMQTPGVPLDEGTLRGSGSVHVNGKFHDKSKNVGGHPEPNMDDERDPAFDGVLVAVGFNTDYAAAQHEGRAVQPDGRVIEFRDYTHSGTGAKFLETPLAQNGDSYHQIMFREIKGALR